MSNEVPIIECFADTESEERYLQKNVTGALIKADRECENIIITIPIGEKGKFYAFAFEYDVLRFAIDQAKREREEEQKGRSLDDTIEALLGRL